MPTAVTIQAFGHIASLLGGSEVTVACDRQLAVSAILAQLEHEHPLFAEYMSRLNDFEESVLILRNGKAEGLESIIYPGDVLVFVTPVSGG